MFGNRALNVIPQTSTIASHLPRAVGLAFGGKSEQYLAWRCQRCDLGCGEFSTAPYPRR